MLKSEVADYADKIISIVHAHGPESLLVNPVFNLLLAKEPEIEILRLSYGADNERLRTNKLKAKMMLANMFYRSISIRDANNKRKANMDKTEDSESNDSTGESEIPAEQDTSMEVETTAMNGSGAVETVKVFEASTIEMMDSLSGQTSIIESGNGSLESVDKEKAVDSRWGSSQQPFDNDNA